MEERCGVATIFRTLDTARHNATLLRISFFLFFPPFLSFSFFFPRVRSIIRMDRERRISRPYVEITRHATATANFRRIMANQMANTLYTFRKIHEKLHACEFLNIHWYRWYNRPMRFRENFTFRARSKLRYDNNNHQTDPYIPLAQ